ncbi:hypothetical protein J437_LFUL003309 [Ladona fulva]|uniref:DUF5641 domain-containing protein n=1 Tax=Ladona fulva TaxID=123851 RepID=A0A8K0KPU3_LADFU|nr:hypothetical protein J437_LFUL003309 [Ladona fulva]
MHKLADAGTNWRYNPPAAPHFGGIWEAAVKSVKHHLRRVIGETKLTYEEVSTLLSQVEACLNSRPLLPLSDDPTDFQVLTPAHFLIQTCSYIVPEADLRDENIPIGKRWKLLQQMLHHFWYRWSSEYLQILQPRGKWRERAANIQPGQLVLLQADKTQPARWPLARVMEIHSGDDGLKVRVHLTVNNYRQ